MTADQFVRSLQRATGQAWDGFETYSAAMGKAGIAEITEHDRTISITFEKFANDAAIATCRAAVDQDVGGSGDVGMPHAQIDSVDDASVRANVQYLLLRFLADEVSLDDPRIEPWAALILAPIEDEESAPDALRERWSAVCVGLATHVDFITY